MAAVLTAAAIYAAVLAWLASCRPRVSGRTLLICLLMAVVWRGAILTLPPIEGSDAIRYIWDARVQRAGLDPYQVRPEDPGVAWVHSEITQHVDAAWLPTIYPPVAQLYFRLVTSADESIQAFRVAAFACDVLTMGLVWAALVRTRRERFWVLAHAWHPLLPIAGAYGGHVDVAGMLALTAAYVALVTRRTALASVAFVAAVLVKPLPVVLAPLFWARVRWRDVALGAAAAGAALAMVAQSLPIGSLGAFVDWFRFNAPLFSLLERLFAPRVLVTLAVVAGLALAVRFRATRPAAAPDAWASPMGLALLLAPVVYPWYLVWLTPFLAATGSVPWLVWSLSALLTYRVWHRRTLGLPFGVPWWLAMVEFGALAVAAAWIWTRRASAGAGSEG